MRVTYDKLADAAYIYLKDIADGEAVQQFRVLHDIILDLDNQGRLLGIEVLRASKTLPEELLQTLTIPSQEPPPAKPIPGPGYTVIR